MLPLQANYGILENHTPPLAYNKNGSKIQYNFEKEVRKLHRFN